MPVVSAGMLLFPLTTAAEGFLKLVSFQPPFMGRDTFHGCLAAPSFVHSGTEHFQGQNRHTSLGSLCQGFATPTGNSVQYLFYSLYLTHLMEITHPAMNMLMGQ